MGEETSPFKVLIIVIITDVIVAVVGIGSSVMSKFYPESTSTLFTIATITLAIGAFIFLYCNEL